MAKIRTKSKYESVCKYVPTGGKYLPANTPKTSLFYQLIPNLNFLVNEY